MIWFSTSDQSRIKPYLMSTVGGLIYQVPLNMAKEGSNYYLNYFNPVKHIDFYILLVAYITQNFI